MNKNTKFIYISIFVFVAFCAPFFSFAHPGRTDAYGCHTCRTNCAKWGLSTGEYHCHRSKGVEQSKEPIKSHKTETGIGYTEPASEYKIPKIAAPSLATKTIEIKKDVSASMGKVAPQQKESFWKKLWGLVW